MTMPQIIDRPSPNFNDRPAGTNLDMLIIHYTGMKSAEESLRASEETARALLNAPTEIALLLDTEGKILALNKPAAEALGNSIDELVGLCVFDLFPPELAERRRAYHKAVLKSGKPVRYEDEREGRWRDTNQYPIFDAAGKVVRVAIFSRDISEQKRAQEALERYSKNLEAQVFS